jgi:hypothetical protein
MTRVGNIPLRELLQATKVGKVLTLRILWNVTDDSLMVVENIRQLIFRFFKGTVSGYG